MSVTRGELLAASQALSEEVFAVDRGYEGIIYVSRATALALKAAAEQLLAMRPATDEEIDAEREHVTAVFSMSRVKVPTVNERNERGWRLAYRAAERRLLPFTDEVKR